MKFTMMYNLPAPMDLTEQLERQWHVGKQHTIWEHPSTVALNLEKEQDRINMTKSDQGTMLIHKA